MVAERWGCEWSSAIPAATSRRPRWMGSSQGLRERGAQKRRVVPKGVKPLRSPQFPVTNSGIRKLGLTENGDVALHTLFCGVGFSMNEIVDRVLDNYGLSHEL